MKTPIHGLEFAVLTFGMFANVASACLDFWSGTAPFCRGGPCPAGYHQTATSSTGDGSKCWTGQKVYCQCDTPVNTCRDYWSGTAPLCKGDTCLPGWDAKYTSNAGDGGVCWSGHKTYCQCTANTGGPLPKCVPGPVKSSCYFYQKICNNGCNLFHCGFCTSIFGKRSIAPSYDPSIDTTDDLYTTLLTTKNPNLRSALVSQNLLSSDAVSAMSDDAVVQYGMNVIDQELTEFKNVDAVASYASWETPSTWVYTNGTVPEPYPPPPPDCPPPTRRWLGARSPRVAPCPV